MLHWLIKDSIFSAGCIAVILSSQRKWFSRSCAFKVFKRSQMLSHSRVLFASISVSERWQRSCNCYFPAPHETRSSTWKLVKLKKKAFDSQMWDANLSTLWKLLYYGRVVLCMWQSRCWPLRFKNSSMTWANARLWLFAEAQMWKADTHACVKQHLERILVHSSSMKGGLQQPSEHEYHGPYNAASIKDL